MYSLTIKVTKEILKRSKFCANNQYIGYNCAVALAVRDIFPNAWVGRKAIHPFGFADGNYPDTRISLPVKASVWIERFDEKTPDERENSLEFSFDVQIPDRVIDKINIDEIKKILENHPTLEISEKC